MVSSHARRPHLFLLYLVTCTRAYQLPLLRSTHASPCSRARLAVCEAEGEGPIAEKEDPKAAAKAEKKALRDAIAILEQNLPAARGELNAAVDSKKDAGESGFMLLAANMERYRQQAAKEVGMQKGYGKTNTLRSLLPFFEEFEQLQKSSESADEGSVIHSYYSGIYKQIQKLLDGWGVTPFEAAAGERFDFNLHQSVARVASDTVPKDMIIEARERGWRMGDTSIRQAKVVLSTGPASVKASEEASGEASK